MSPEISPGNLNRVIPVVMLLPLEELPAFTDDGDWVQEGPVLQGR
jgi:hypothetical protein